MKKYMYLFVIIFLFCGVVIMGHFGLTKTQKYNMCSQIEFAQFYAQNSKYEATIKVGERESVFEFDGKSTNLVQYALLEVSLVSRGGYAKSLDVIIFVANKKILATLVKNPFKESFIVDFAEKICESDEIKIWVNGVDDNYTQLDCVTKEWESTYKDALDKGFCEYEKFILQKRKNGKSCECYLTIAKNVEIDIFFWNFTIKTSDFDTKSMLLDIDNLDVLIKT